ncbi:MAG: UvrD-helicase domain-containing protein, partial [Spirochaetales bacterium]|nr:UvrD-helicase domain-containing protein [Spirochaetales bacterium]
MQKENFFPNEELRPVIESSVNTVVSAGAGAGKTAVLSWRFLRLVMEGGLRPEEILTLTFTKKAASEMRERIYRRLLQAMDSLPADTFESFSRATISTLDSFCAQIVRSDCISRGLPRDITVISDNDYMYLA